MTLGCPEWNLETILKNARAYGYEGIDFRGVQDELDITKSALFTTDLARTKRQIADSGLAVSGISTSIQACNASSHQTNLDEAQRTIPLAIELGAKNIRIFGGGDPGKTPREELARIGRDLIQTILALPGADQLSWNFETHDAWIKSADCALLLNTIANPAFGALWDMGHTARVGGETPEQTYASIGERVRYVHCKDAARDPSAPADNPEAGWKFVLPGTGQLPLEKALRLLAAKGYDGWVLFEHEKRWHPTLQEPESAFPAFISWVKPILKAVEKSA